MRKIAFLSVVFGILLLLFGCKKEPKVTQETPKFTLTISPENGDEEVGEKIPITISTIGGDSIAFSTKEKTTIHSYSRPDGITGEWKIVDTLNIMEEGLNQADVYVFQFLPEGQVVIKDGRVDIIGHYPELNVSANPPQISWRTKSSITIASAYGDSLIFSDLPGVNGKLNGTFPTPLLDSTTTFHGALWNIKTNNVTLREVTIYVDLPTKQDTLCKFGLWGKVMLEFRADYPGSPWYEVDLPLCEKDNREKYEPYSTSMIRRTIYFLGIECFIGGEPDSDYGIYSLVWPFLRRETGYEQEIELLTQDTLILLSPMVGSTEKYRVRETFIHP